MSTPLEQVAARALETWNATLDLPHCSRMQIAIEAGLRHAHLKLTPILDDDGAPAPADLDYPYHGGNQR